MFIKLLIIFIFIPLLEIYILLEAGRIIGLGPTLGLIILTGIAGAWLARSQGLEILRKIQTETSSGQMPAATLIDGALVLVGGLTLLTPGFFTDAIGFSLIILFTRELWKKAFQSWLEKQIRQGTLTVNRF